MMSSSYKWSLVVAFLFLNINCCSSFLVQRAEEGDIFQNLGSGAGYCAERNALCSVASLDDRDPSCASNSIAGPSCPSCVCSAGGKYDNASDSCLEDNCPGYGGFKFFNSMNKINAGEQSIFVNATFLCPGMVTAWRYIRLTPTEETFFFLQVWRLTGPREAVRIGSTRIETPANLTAGRVEVLHNLETSEQIVIQPGDFIGVFAPEGTAKLPFASRRFQTANQSEAYTFEVTNGVLPTTLDLAERSDYDDNAAANIQAITGYYEGEIECFALPMVTPTTGRPQQITTTLQDQKPTVQTTPIQKILMESSLMQATGIKSDSSILKTSASAPLASAAARVTSTNRLILLQTSTPVPMTDPNRTGEQNERENGSSSSASLSPVSVTLIAVSISILLVVSITLVAVCLLYRRRYGDKRKRPSIVPEDTRHAQDRYPLELLSSLSSREHNDGPPGLSNSISVVSPLQSREQSQPRAASADPPYYHILGEGNIQSQSVQSLNKVLNIHIHYDSDPRFPSSNARRSQEQIFHIVVPTKDERMQAYYQEDRYSMGGPKSDEECIQSLGRGHTPEEYFQEEHTYWVPADNEDELYCQFARCKYREMLRKYISLGEELGSGHFGSVQKGTWNTHEGPTDVAVKTLKPGLSERERVKFLQEAAIMGQFSHANIVQLHGVVTVGEPVMIILELLLNGDLRNHLLALRNSLGKSSSQNFPHRFLKFTRQIALGMQYLSSKGFVHRDLAARNVLLDNELVCKIGDFGMARDLLQEEYYYIHGGPIPVKWTAPEALTFRKYTSASDVWSYGVVLFEIWSVGTKPFASMNNLEVVSLVSQGHRLPPPPGCSKEVYQLMLECWHPDPEKRPSFTEIIELLSVDDELLLSWQEEWRLKADVKLAGPPMTRDSICSIETQYVTVENQPRM